MKTFRSVILMLVIIALIAFPLPGVADDESPWGEILNPDGSIRWDLLSDLGTVSESADWMDITLPGGHGARFGCHLSPLPDPQR